MSRRGHPADRGGDGLLHGGRRVRACDERRDRSSSKGTGTIFLGGPPLVKAATGEEVTAEELGGADVHTRISRRGRPPCRGRRARARASRATSSRHLDTRARRVPLGRARRPKSRSTTRHELYGIVPADLRKPYDVREVIARLVDGVALPRVQGALRHDAGLRLRAHLTGYPVGIVANNGVLFTECALKAHALHRAVRQRGIPLVFLQNITGFMVGKQYEHGGIAKDGAKMVHAVANAAVPKFTVIIGGASARATTACAAAPTSRASCGCGRTRASPSWAASRRRACSLTVKQRAASSAQGRRSWTEEETRRSRRRSSRQYEHEGSPYYATARLWDDGVHRPARDAAGARARVGRVPQRAASETKFGVFRHVSPDYAPRPQDHASSSPTAARSPSASSAPPRAGHRARSPSSPRPTARAARARSPTRPCVHRAGAGARELPRDRARSSRRPCRRGADAIHPGYGFLAENADVRAGRASDAGSDVRRPAAAAIARDGRQDVGAQARDGAAGVPVVPGSTAARRGRGGARRRGRAIGYPGAA